MADRTYFLDTRFDRMPVSEAVEILVDRALARRGSRVYYANAHTMVTAARDRRLAEALADSDLLLADGSGVRWGSAWHGNPLKYNLNGTDLVPALCQAGASGGLSVYLLGGKPHVTPVVAERLAAQYPGLRIAGFRHGYHPPEETALTLAAIREAQPHLLLVAMGVPLQELWIHQYADYLPGIMCMGVGGLFDFLSGSVPRAPRLVRAVGMEWSWRLAMEPGRLWQRYLIGNLVFLRMVLSYHPAQPVYQEASPADGSALIPPIATSDLNTALVQAEAEMQVG